MLLLAISQKYLRELGRHHYYMWIGFVATLGLALGMLVWAASVLVSGQVMRMVISMQVPQSIEVIYNDIYAQTLKEAIAQRLESLPKEIASHTFSPESWSKALLSEFSIIEHVIWDARRQGLAQCRLIGVRPCACINNNLVLGENGRLYQRFLFSDESLVQSAYIAMPSVQAGDYLAQELVALWRGLKKELRDSYSICYHSAHEIILTSRREVPKHTIICNQKTFAKENFYAPIYKMVNHAQTIASCTKNQHYFCDVRYKNRVIVSRQAMHEFCDETHTQLLATVVGRGHG